MKYRKITIQSGETFNVPSHIVRLDSPKTHGWQIRYGASTIDSHFQDTSSDNSGARQSLENAIEALKIRVSETNAPTGLKKTIMPWKTSDLPVGISGHDERLRKGRNFIQYSFQVTVPSYENKSQHTTVYIGTENTISEERYAAALEKAKQIRHDAEVKYQEEATRAMRAKHN